MQDGKENVVQGSKSRRNNRRSSILKESPGRKPLESVMDKAKQRRSLKRVSFADTKTIKEFMATVGNATEWNSTYEATASLESSSSMDITGLADKSIRVNEVGVQDVNAGVNPGPSVVTNKADSASSSSSDANLDTSNFLNDFLEMEPTISASALLGDQIEPEGTVESPTEDNFLTDFLKSSTPKSTLTNTDEEVTSGMERSGPSKQLSAGLPTLTHLMDRGDNSPTDQMNDLFENDVAQMMLDDLKMTCSQGNANKTPSKLSQVAGEIGDKHMNELLYGDLTGKLNVQTNVARQTTGVGQSECSQNLNFNADMEMTCSANQMVKVGQVDRTQKITADMEITCPASQMAKVGQVDHTQKITADMEMTCSANQMVKVGQVDHTQKMTADMEMTCPANQMAKVAQVDHTQKITADMEMTCPANQMVKVGQVDHTQKITADMEMTCPANQMVKVGQVDHTQKITADMEMTCPANQMVKVGQVDHTQKMTADMEMTCPANQMARVAQVDHTQKITADMEMTCPANQMVKVGQVDHTQKMTADMEITCPANQMAKVGQVDHTQKITADMEMTCPANQMAKVIQVDHTQKITADMEMTCPANQIAKIRQVDFTQKLTADMEMTCPANQMAKVGPVDHTQKIAADMEMTCSANQMAKISHAEHTQKLTADMEMTSPATQVARLGQEDHTQKLTADMEMTFPANQMVKMSQTDCSQRIASDKEESHVAKKTTNFSQLGSMQMADRMDSGCPTRNVATFSRDDITQKVTTDMEMTCPTNQLTNFGQDELMSRMEMSRRKSQNCYNQMSADMEITCHSNQLTRTGQVDSASQMTQLDPRSHTQIRLDTEMACITNQVSTGLNTDCQSYEVNGLSQGNDRLKGAALPASDPMTLPRTTESRASIAGPSKTSHVGLPLSDDLGDLFSSSRSSMSRHSNVRKSIVNVDTTSAPKGASQMIQLMLQDNVGKDKITGESSEGQVNESGLTAKLNEMDLTLPNYEARDSQEEMIPNLKTSDAIFKRDCALGKDTQSSLLTGLLENNERKALDKGLNVTCPASRVSEMIKSLPQRKSMGVGLPSAFSNTEKDKTTDNGSLEAELHIESDQLTHDQNTEIPRRKSILALSPFGLDKTCDLSRPLFRSFFDEPEQEEAAESGEDLRDEIKESEALSSPKQGVKRSSSEENYEEHSPKVRAIGNGRVAVNPMENDSDLLSGKDKDPLPPMEKQPVSQSEVSMESPSIKTRSSSASSSGEMRLSQQPTNVEHSKDINVCPEKSIDMEFDNIKDPKDQSLSEEGLDDIQMEFEHSLELNLSHSPIKMEPQTDAPLSPANKTLFDSVGADALSCVSALTTSFKKRVSEVHERSLFFEKDPEDEESFEAKDLKDRSITKMSILQLTKSFDDSAEDLEADESASENPKEEFDKMLDSLSKSKSQLFTSFLGDNADDGLEGQQERTSSSSPSKITTKGDESQKMDSSAIENSVNRIESNTECEKKNVASSDKLEDKPSYKSIISKCRPDENICSLCGGSDIQIGSLIQTSSGISKWTLTGVNEGVRYLALQFTPLELALNVTKTDRHWTVMTATWKPQVSDLSNGDAQLVMKVLGCRIKAAVLQLYGLAMCEIGDALERVSAAYEDLNALLLELQMVKMAYLTDFAYDSLKVDLFSTSRHRNVKVTIQVSPPAPTPEKPFTVKPSASVTVGNLRSQTVQEALAEVTDGPRYILRLLKAADLVVQGMA